MGKERNEINFAGFFRVKMWSSLKQMKRRAVFEKNYTENFADTFLDLVKGASAGIIFEIHFLGIHKLFC